MDPTSSSNARHDTASPSTLWCLLIAACAPATRCARSPAGSPLNGDGSSDCTCATACCSLENTSPLVPEATMDVFPSLLISLWLFPLLSFFCYSES